MSWTPANIEAQCYRGDDFGYVLEFIENGSPLDLTTVNSITVVMYTKGEDLVTHTGSDLTISGTDDNILSGVFDSSETDVKPREYLFKVVFELPKTRTYVLGTLEIFDDPEEGSTVSSFRIEIDDETKTANSSQLTDLTGLALDAKKQAEAIRDALQWKGAWDSNTPYAEDNRVSYQGESFISLQDGNQGNTPVGDSNDSFWDILAEKGQDGADGDFSDVENVQDLGSISGSTQIDLDNGTIIQATLTGSITLSFTGLPSANTVYNFTLAFSGAETITYPSGTEFAGGSAPSIIGSDYELPCSIDSAGNLTVYGVIDEIA